MANKLFKVKAVHRLIVKAYNDGEVISIHRYLELATYGLYKGGKVFEIILQKDDALKHFEEGGYVLADIKVSIDKSTNLKKYTANTITPLEKDVAIHSWHEKAPWEYEEDGI